MKIQKTIGTLMVTLMALCAFSTASSGKPAKSTGLASSALDAERVVFSDATPLSDKEMQNLRGGFIDPTGMIVSFAVDIRAALDGAEIFTRSFNVSRPDHHSAELQMTTQSAVLTQNVPSNVNVSMIGEGKGIRVTDASGNRTTILNQTSAGAPSSIIFNTSDNTNITQTVNMSLTLNNMSSIMDFAKTAAHGIRVPTAGMRFLGF
jgi:hypothetical protein